MTGIIVIVFVTLLFSMFFSGMEIAFVTSNKLRLEIERRQNRTFNHIADIFLRHPGHYVTSMSAGRNIALVIYSTFMTLLLRGTTDVLGWASFERGQVLIEILVSAVIIIFAAELLPRVIVRQNPNLYMRFFAAPAYVLYLLLYPIVFFFTWLSTILLRLFGLRTKAGIPVRGFDKDDLEYLVDQAAETGGHGGAENEIKLFQNALDFPDIKVRDCMVPRIDIEAVEIGESIIELTQRFVKTQYSRIFVYDGSIDNIIGYVNTKSMFQMPATIAEVVIPVDFVPESFSAQRMLDMFITKKSSVAVVVDEFGGTAGMISMEDILEEIFGDIEDEHDEPDMVEKVVADGEYILSCRLETGYLNEKYGLGITESDEYDTLAGYIIYNREGIPERGEVMEIDGNEITILRKGASKLEVARVRKLDKNI